MSASSTLDSAPSPYEPAAQTRVQIMPEQWQEFLKARPRPARSNRISDTKGSKLDSQMLEFLNDNSTTSWSLQAKSEQRLWLHQTAQYLALLSYSEGDGTYNYVKTITLSKTAQTALPDNMEEAVERVRLSSQARRQASKAASKTAKRVKRAEKEAAMDRWSTYCNDCGETLTAWEALYHHSGTGPLCQDCVDSDDYLTGLKWEPKATFWH